MTTPSDRPGTRRWRSRAFLQPLLVTIVGIWVVPTLIYFAWSASVGPLSDASPCTGECGTARLAAGLVTGIVFLLVWCVDIVIVGFIAGRSSRDRGLALPAVLVGVLLPPLAGAALLVVPGAIAISEDVPFAIGSNLAGGALIGLIVLIPMSLGFAVGRSTRPSPKEQADTTGRE